MDAPIIERLAEWLESAPGDKAAISKNLKVVDDTALGRCITADQTIEKNEILIQIPKKFLLNYTTILRHLSYNNKNIKNFLKTKIFHFDGKTFPTNADEITSLYAKLDYEDLLKLTSHQILTLYISLERRRGEGSFWYPLLSSFPPLDAYRSIPMTWNLHSSSEDLHRLFNLLPRSAIKHAESQCRQFNVDVDKISMILKKNNVFLKEEEFLWAWLAVNTRCLYYKLPKYLPITESEESEASNITMVPFVDFINHKTADHNCLARESKSGYEVISTTKISSGGHLWFTYGPHDDEFLQCEYGFLTSQTKRGDPQKYQNFNIYNSINISPIIIKLLGVPKRKNTYKWLKQTNYYGDYTLGIDDISKIGEDDIQILVRPSFRTRVALASLTEADDGFHYNGSRSEIDCPVKLQQFCGGFNDGKCYEKSETVLLEKILSKVKKDMYEKLDTLAKLKLAEYIEHTVVKQLLLNQIFLLNSFR